MSEEKILLAGLDLCEDETQLACYDAVTKEPESVSVSDDPSDYLIPTVLAVKPDTKEWLFGKEAAKNPAGAVRIDRLLSRILKGETFELGGMVYSPEFLLERYLRKVLGVLKARFPDASTRKLTVTLTESDPVLINAVYRVLKEMGIGRDRAVVQNHSQSFMHYTLSQPKDLWMNDVGMFELDQKGLNYYQLSVNRRTVPMTAAVAREDLSATFGYDLIEDELPPEQLDYIFDNLARSVLHKKIVSTLYITGKGFAGNWADETLKGLCVGRRVFKGQNLYAKGACYASLRMYGNDRQDYILLDEQMLPATLKIRLYEDARMADYVLAAAGTPWYEAQNEIDVILDDTAEFDFVVSNPLKRESAHQLMTLDGFIRRENKTNRMNISVRFLDRNTAVIAVRDRGFGGFYRSDHRIWEQILLL